MIDFVEVVIIVDNFLNNGLWVDFGIGSGVLVIVMVCFFFFIGLVIVVDVSLIVVVVVWWNVEKYEFKVSIWFYSL